MLPLCSSADGNSGGGGGGGLEGVFTPWWGCIRYVVTTCSLE